MLPALAPVFTLLAAGAGVEVAGSGDCPTPGEVTARVAALLPPSAQAPGTVEVGAVTGELRVLLRQPDGAVAAERRLPVAGLACADLAAAAAAVIATWTSDVHPDFAPSRPPAPALVVSAGARPAAAGPAFAAALGAVASAAPAGGDAGWAAGVEVAGLVYGAARTLGARLAVGSATERRFAVGGGRAFARRWVAALGPVYALDGGGGPLRVELGAGAALSWFTVRGGGFARNLSDGEVDYGGGASLALSLRRRWWAPFTALEATAWPRRRTAVDLETGVTRSLPRAELGLVLGLRAGPP
jgi:hypothetical protein